jgi:molecular chaperone GrpE
VVPDPEAPDAPAPEAGEATGGSPEPSVEDLLEELEAVIVQRDEYLELARAKQADFENFRKQAAKRQLDLTEQAAAGLVRALLPVLDALDNGVGHGDESLVPVRSQLLGVLEKEGLVRVDPADDAFDPNEHDAVAHEPGDGGEASVAETLRAGYRWNGRLLRPAMVRVRS